MGRRWARAFLESSVARFENGYVGLGFISVKSLRLFMFSCMSGNQEVRGNTLKVYMYLLRHGPSELRDVQRGVGLSSASLASYHLGKLLEGGFVVQDEQGRYSAVREASYRVLDGYSRVGPAIVPQLFFFALLFTILAAFFSFEALNAQGFTMYLVAVCAVMVLVFWYETLRLWRKLAV